MGLFFTVLGKMNKMTPSKNAGEIIRLSMANNTSFSRKMFQFLFVTVFKANRSRNILSDFALDQPIET